MRALSIMISVTCCVVEANSADFIGSFDPEHDLFLAQFDLKTDVDDVHSIAAVANMLADPRFAGVKHHTVAGAYGRQEGEYVPANELIKACYGDNWSDAHADFEGAAKEVSQLVQETLQHGGAVWIADAGQSDFSAAVIRKVIEAIDEGVVKRRVHVVQHSDWNEDKARPKNLAYVKEHATYHRIADGNQVGNGTPGFKTTGPIDWRQHVSDPQRVSHWELAIKTASEYNGEAGRYDNPAVAGGGFDFSDASEACWIFGFEHLVDAEEFFAEFNQSSGAGQ